MPGSRAGNRGVTPLRGGYSIGQSPSRLDDCWRNRPQASQCAHWLGLDRASPLEYRAYKGVTPPKGANCAL